MIIWITGAKGFIGQHLAKHYAINGNVVFGLGYGYGQNAINEANLSAWLEGEISRYNLTRLRLLHGSPDLVVHLAGGSSVSASIANPHEDFSRTIISTVELLEWLRLESPVTRLIAVSSAAVYGSGHTGPISETAVIQPISPYGYHKYMMEQLCSSYGSCYSLNCAIVRPFSVYGPGLHRQLLWDICRHIHNESSRIELSGSGNELRDFIHVLDLLKAIDIVADLTSSAVPIFNVSSGIAISVRDISEMVINAFTQSKWNYELIFNGKVKIGDPISLAGDIKRIQSYGFKSSHMLEQGIIEYVCWFREYISSRDRI